MLASGVIASLYQPVAFREGCSMLDVSTVELTSPQCQACNGDQAIKQCEALWVA